MTFGLAPSDPVTYLAQVADSDAGRSYKARLLATLGLLPGQTVLDIGCGPGTDLADMAAEVGPTGTVLGVDLDETMVAAGRERHAADPVIDIHQGDAHALPVASASVDRVRTDRAVQHMADPAAVLAEVRRVLRPGGVACLAEPDWSTLAVDPGNPATSRAVNRFVCTSIVRNAVVGRQLARLGERVGLTVRGVLPTAPLFRDFVLADRILGLRRNASRAVEAGHLDRTSADRWLVELAAGPFLATVTLFTVVFEKG